MDDLTGAGGFAAGDDALWISAPFKLTICITERCNLRCRHCYTDCNRARSELSTDEWFRVVDDLIKEGFIAAFFEGGEPFCRDDFEAIVARAARKMFVSVRTNATLIDAARAARIRAARAGRVYVDLLGASAAVNDYLVGCEGAYRQSLAGVKALKDAGLPVTLLIILNRHNAHELPDYLRLAAQEGADEVGILRLYPLGRAAKAWCELALSLEEMTAALGSLVAPPGVEVMQSWHPNNKNCCWQNAAINAGGRSIGCPYLRDFVDYGDVREAGFQATWRHPLYRELRMGGVEESCSTCSSVELTHGGCRSTAYAFHGRWDAADPFCPTKNKGIDLRVLPTRPILQQP